MLHHRLQPLQRLLLHHGCGIPRIALAVPRHYFLQEVDGGVGELVGNGFCHLAVSVLCDPALRLGDGVGEALNHIRMLRHIALAGEICRVGDLAALFAHRAEDVALACQLHLGGGGLKEGHIVAHTAGEGTGHHIELHGGIHHGIHVGDHAVLRHHILQRHLRHTALAAANDGLAPQIFPGKVLVGAAYEERAVPLGQLGEDDGIVSLALIVHVDAAFGPCQTDVGLTGHYGGHHLVGAATVGQFHRQPFFGKKALTHCHILRRVKHGVGDLVEPHHCVVILCAAAPQGQQQTHRQQTANQFFQDCTPQK